MSGGEAAALPAAVPEIRAGAVWIGSAGLRTGIALDAVEAVACSEESFNDRPRRWRTAVHVRGDKWGGPSFDDAAEAEAWASRVLQAAVDARARVRS